MASKINPKTGRAYGVSKNTAAKGNTYTDSKGYVKIIDKAPAPKAPTQRIFSSDNNAVSQERNRQDMERQQLEYEKKVAAANLLNEAKLGAAKMKEVNEARAAQGLVPMKYKDTAEYSTNRKSYTDLLAAYPQQLKDLKEKQTAEVNARQDKQRADQLARLDAARLIWSGFDPLTVDRIQKAGRSVHELTPDYLKSIGMVNQAGTGLYGAGSSDFDFEKGFVGPSMDDRRQLKQFRDTAAQLNLNTPNATSNRIQESLDPALMSGMGAYQLARNFNQNFAANPVTYDPVTGSYGGYASGGQSQTVDNLFKDIKPGPQSYQGLVKASYASGGQAMPIGTQQTQSGNGGGQAPGAQLTAPQGYRSRGKYGFNVNRTV